MAPTQIAYAELAGRAAALAAGDDRRILGIAGPPGAGKSTLARAIVSGLEGRASLVPMDGFHLPGDQLERLGRAGHKGAPDTFDAEGYVALLRRLREPGDQPVHAPDFRREIEEPVPGAIRIPPEVRLVVTEGNYLLLDHGPWRQVRPLLDEAWYLPGDDASRVDRLITRHVEHGRSPEQARDWVARVDEANADLVHAARGRADLVVSASGPRRSP